MIKRNGQRIAAIAMTVALMGQNVSPIFSLESLKGIETVTSENEAKAEELAPQDQYEETEKSELDLSNTQEKEESNKITILHTNDTHGRLKADNKIIGIDTVAAIKNNTENSILVDAGDTIHGLPFVTLSKGQDAVDLLNAAGYEYIVPGNHDFNYGYSRLMELFKNSVTLKSGENKLRLLASNINKDGKSVFEANHIKEMEVNGKTVKVGFFGIATQETAYKTNPNNVKGIEFTSPVDAAKEQVEELEKQGADVIVALSHVGTDESSDPTAYDVIKAVDGIDVYRRWTQSYNI